MNQLFVLNHQKSLFSAYARDKSIVFASYNGDKMQQLQNILNTRYAQSRTWCQQIVNIRMYAENHIQIDLTENNYCALNACNDLHMTYLDTENETDMLFVYQLKHLMNAHVYVMSDFEYDSDLPLLSLQGLFVEYNPDNVAIDHLSYLNASLSL